jgi:tetratricopeptide (TPR) repeat protein
MNQNLKNCLIVILLFVSFSFIAYGSSLKNEFLVDDYYFKDNLYRGAFLSWGDFFRTSDSQHFSPVYDLLNVYLFRTWGEDPLPYRAFNVVLFGLVCSALYFYLQRLGVSKPASLLTSLLFLVHPVNAHCVNYITCNYVFLFVLFLMASHHFFISATEDKEKRRASRWGLSLLFFILSLLSFEGAFLFPLYLANDMFIRRKMALKKTFIHCLPFLILTIIYLILWKLITGANSQAFSLLLSSISRWMAVIPALSYLIYWYISNLFFPREIVLIYHVPPPSVISAAGLAATALLVSGTAFLFYFLRKDRMKRFSLIWFLVGSILFIPAAFAHYDMGLIIEPHWFLFSSIGLFLFIALLLTQWRHSSKNPWVQKTLITLILISLFALTQGYNAMARTEESYCRHWLKIAPGNNIALINLAKSSLLQGRSEDAINYYKQSLQSRNNLKNALAYRNIAKIYSEANRWEEARIYLEKSIKLNPGDAETFNRMGIYFANKEQFDEAEKYFLKSLELAPYSVPTVKNLSRLYLLRNQYQDMIEMYNDYKKLPLLYLNEKIDAHTALAILYIKTNQKQKSFDHISETIKLDPSGKSYFKLCEAVYHEGAERFAEELLKNYIEYFEPSSDAYLLYGVLLGNQKQYQEAIQIWQKGLALDPSDQRFEPNIKGAKQLLAIHPTTDELQ